MPNRPDRHSQHDPYDDSDGERRRTGALIGLIVTLVLLLAGVFLTQKLKKQSELEDCFMSGRTNCAPIEAPPRR